jgi:CheY-like chemotaxis protein
MHNILVVDDDMINRKLLSVLLKKTGKYNVIEAENGLEALNILKNSPIDMVLLDIIMPVMDGMDFLKVAKAEDNYKSIPVIILTTDDTRKSEGLANGAVDVLIKPIKEATLFPIIEKYLS